MKRVTKGPRPSAEAKDRDLDEQTSNAQEGDIRANTRTIKRLTLHLVEHEVTPTPRQSATVTTK